jgi:MFS family permease
MEKVGDNGRYQKITFVFWCICSYLCTGLLLMKSFLFFEDPYVCPSSLNLDAEKCFDHVCNLPTDQRLAFIPDASISSLANKLGDYRCPAEAADLSLAMSFIYANGMCAFFVLSLVGDYLGRKRQILIGLLLTTGGITLAFFSNYLAIAAVGIFLGLAGTQWFSSGSFFFISETVGEQSRERYLVAVQIAFGLSCLVNSGFYYWLRDWKLVLTYFYIVPAILLIIGILWIVADTPIGLIQKCTAEEAHNEFMGIAKINGIDSTLTI